MFHDIKNIFFPLNGNVPLNVIMPTALMIAQKFQARLSTILLDNTSEQLIAFAGEGLATGTITEMMDEALNHTQARLKEIHTLFDILQKEGKHQWYPLSRNMEEPPNITLPHLAPIPQTSFEVLDNSNNNALIFRSRLADMTIVPPLKDNKDPQSSEILHNILFDSGRPLLIMPSSPKKHIGNHIAIAWNGSAEASIALRCALPWLKNAQKITLLHNTEYHSIGPDASMAKEFLALHQISSEIQEFTSEKRAIGAGLLSHTHKIEADMLVMGAYSHSRLRQMILGGVTRYLLENADLPLLMSR